MSAATTVLEPVDEEVVLVLRLSRRQWRFAGEAIAAGIEAWVQARDVPPGEGTPRLAIEAPVRIADLVDFAEQLGAMRPAVRR